MAILEKPGGDERTATERYVRLANSGEATVDRRIYADPDIYELELERIFTKVWLFLGHESEIPESGAWVRRRMAEDGVIVCRGKDGQIRVFLNACLHRGVEICWADEGCAASFECPYHGWTYANTGKLMTLGPLSKAIHPDLDERKSRYGGLTEARVDTYNGLIFATWNWDGPSLEEYLGGWQWYLDMATGRTPSGVEVVGPPHRWTFDGNWKLPCDQFTDDNHHVATLHRGVFQLGILAISAFKFGASPYAVHTIHPKWGHTRGTIGLSGAVDAPYLNVPPELRRLYEQKLDAKQLEQFFNMSVDISMLFPYTAVARFTFPGEEGEAPIPYTVIRNYEPRGAGQLEIQSWVLVDREAPQWMKERSQTNATRQFSPAGLFEMDDAIPWSSTAHTARGAIGRKQLSYFHQGWDLAPMEDWPYPGVTYPTNYTERVMINWYKAWQGYMSQEM